MRLNVLGTDQPGPVSDRRLRRVQSRTGLRQARVAVREGGFHPAFLPYLARFVPN